MSEYLTLSVRFLDNRFHGRIERGREGEWPPSPMRLFQAMLAGAAPRWVDAAVREFERPAFAWLERQPAPTIIAPAARAGKTLLTYVPNNNRGSWDEPFDKVRTAKLIEPMILGDDRHVEYCYAFDPSDAEAVRNAKILQEIARHIRCVGWGIDLAIGHATIGQPASVDPFSTRFTYTAAPATFTGGSVSRVPTDGTLASVEEVHAEKLGRFAERGTLTLGNRQATFSECVYADAPRRRFVAFRFRDEDDEDVAYRIEHIKQLAGQLRRLAAKLCEGQINDAQLNGAILGHPQDAPRLSILPLPSIGHQHVDGRIRRVIFAEPFGAGIDLCETLLSRLNQQKLVFEGNCHCPPSRLVPLSRDDRVLARYSQCATDWASVTPVLLPGHNQRKQDDHRAALNRACKLIEKSLWQAGIQTPAEFAIDRIPYWPGTHHVRNYDPRDKLAHCPRYHVKITFSKPVNGPLAIGAGRHVGFGTLAAMDGSSQRS